MKQLYLTIVIKWKTREISINSIRIFSAKNKQKLFRVKKRLIMKIISWKTWKEKPAEKSEANLNIRRTYTKLMSLQYFMI